MERRGGGGGGRFIQSQRSADETRRRNGKHVFMKEVARGKERESPEVCISLRIKDGDHARRFTFFGSSVYRHKVTLSR